MTKIILTIELDIPKIDQFSDAEISQLIFDEYINHATCAHLEDASHWMVKQGIAEKEGKPAINEKMITSMHQTWGEICSKAKWTWKKENKVKPDSDENRWLDEAKRVNALFNHNGYVI